MSADSNFYNSLIYRADPPTPPIFLLSYGFVFNFVQTIIGLDKVQTVPDSSGNMREQTLKIMAGLETRINTLRNLDHMALGQDEGVAAAELQYRRLMKYVERKVEALCEKGGAE